MIESLTTSFSQFASEARPPLERALEGYLRPVPGCPAELTAAMRYSLLAPAKRLRPLLVLMAADACGGQREAALPAACAVEMIHTYSLIHDDLPAMDDDDLRRGRPTNHKVHGEALAILAGDALLTLAFEILARDVDPPAVAAVCCAELARAAGATGLVGGQADDLAAERQAGQRQEALDRLTSLELLESIHRRKTGAMFLVSLRLGGRVAGATPAQLEALTEYGRKLGLAFQIVDDLLDVRGTEQAAGKRVGKDAERGKLTFPGLLGVGESEARANRLLAEACTAVQPWGPAAEGLVALARYVTERDC